MPRMFKYGNIPNISFTPDKELNILLYRSPSYLIYRIHILLKIVRFLAHPVYHILDTVYNVLINAFGSFRQTSAAIIPALFLLCC